MHINNKLSTNTSSLQGLRVLLVDNDVNFCNSLTPMLQSYGVKVQTAFLGKQALEIFEQWQPDILLNGISWPKEDSYALIHQVRTLTGERGKVVPAIALTGTVTEDMYQNALLAGFSLCFAKPVVIDDFVAVLGILAIANNPHPHAN
ncbi:multi-sensor hybrid histidine kinase [Nostoc commune NIES-4072]|uniref:Multi-sensor hybrid histidine kinase n=1 Tax=Nostoc commune NIES-4072 TaxID=2005467 RepID=A0A2R5FQ04_NOSCO|nr:response regulator [Nostoc commune]BBD68164.1 multi-sensor hybrid histidine kinase [Nostoc commune HK-02]GBG20842.1 multi-sensor hybrid histidine kinase [Nostoc commune NIES-4072]